MPPLPCSLSALRSARRWRWCVCVDVLALVGNDFEKRSNTPNSQYHPISPHWNQHGGVVIGWNVLLLHFFLRGEIFWHQLVSYQGCAGWWLMIQIYRKKGWAGGLSFGSVVFRVWVFVRVCVCWITVCIRIYPSPSSHFCNVCLAKWANIAAAADLTLPHEV